MDTSFGQHEQRLSERPGPSNATRQSPAGLEVAASMDSLSGRREKKVLAISITNCKYLITLEILKKLFEKRGDEKRGDEVLLQVVRVILRRKGTEEMWALVEMGTNHQCSVVKFSFNGQNIYQDCCTLHIGHSEKEDLKLQYNNNNSCDYTKILPPYGPHFQQMGMVYNQAPQQMRLFPSPNGFQQGSSIRNLALPLPCNGTPVLHLSNLNESEVDPNVLFKLLGVYGDVIRVKILYSSKSSALVQMANSKQAGLVKTHLSGVMLLGKPLRIVESKHTFVQMPKEGRDEQNLTRDYTNSNLHRFRIPGSKNFSHIYPPSEVLHLSNIPRDISKDDILCAFNQHLNNSSVLPLKFFPKEDHGRRMAQITLPSVNDGIHCLVKMHNYQLVADYCLKVSFSKRPNATGELLQHRRYQGLSTFLNCQLHINCVHGRQLTNIPHSW